MLYLPCPLCVFALGHGMLQMPTSMQKYFDSLRPGCLRHYQHYLAARGGSWSCLPPQRPPAITLPALPRPACPPLKNRKSKIKNKIC